MATDSVHGKPHSPSCVVSCAAVVTVGDECGVDIVWLIEGVIVEDGVVKTLVVEDVVEEAVVDMPGAAAWGVVEMKAGGGDTPYTAID